MGKRRTQSVTTKKKRISKNTNYKKGRRFEYRVKKHFEKLGYYVKRSYASKGAEDLNAQKKVYVRREDIDGYDQTYTEVLHIQCKNLAVERPLSQKERTALLKLAKQTGGTPLHVYNDCRYKIVVEVIR